MTNADAERRIAAVERRVTELEHQQMFVRSAIAILACAAQSQLSSEVNEMMKTIIGRMMSRRPCQH